MTDYQEQVRAELAVHHHELATIGRYRAVEEGKVPSAS